MSRTNHLSEPTPETSYVSNTTQAMDTIQRNLNKMNEKLSRLENKHKEYNI